ncbi:MAG: glycosyltransferase [Planctomycetes bacterium]|nr:glycosyltransferase [Planctomycetota bacterium]
MLHLGKYYPPALGGIEIHVQALARGQAALGADVTVVAVNHTRGEDDTTYRALARTRTVEEQDGAVRVVRVGRLASIAHKLSVAPRLPFLLRRLGREADLIHLHCRNPTMSAGLRAIGRLPAPLVITHHSDVARQRILRRALLALEGPLYRRARRILATSPAYAQGSAVLQDHMERVRALPLGIDLAPFASPSPEALAEAASLRERYPGPLWLMVGRLVYYKGHEVALDALKGLPGTLIVIGTGPLAGSLWESAQRLGLIKRVVFLGEVEASVLEGAYQAATAFWFPSLARSEGFGLVQVEAMASGTPVINTTIPGSGVHWVSPHEETGLTVPAVDPAAFRAAAQRLLDEPELGPSLGAAGRVRAAEKFSRERMARTSLAHYREVLS